MKIVVDMNLPPRFCAVLAAHGHDAVHWSQVGDPRAPDRTVMEWASTHGCVVLTHDLDFGALLAATQAHGPSVVQLRIGLPLPEITGDAVAAALRAHADALASGALVSVDADRARVRVLPLR